MSFNYFLGTKLKPITPTSPHILEVIEGVSSMKLIKNVVYTREKCYPFFSASLPDDFSDIESWLLDNNNGYKSTQL